MLLVLVVGDVLGAGIYALVGEVGGRVGGATWTAFLVALALAIHRVRLRRARDQGPAGRRSGALCQQGVAQPFVTSLVAFAVMGSA